jgi:hypothetical protein
LRPILPGKASMALCRIPVLACINAAPWQLCASTRRVDKSRTKKKEGRYTVGIATFPSPSRHAGRIARMVSGSCSYLNFQART